MSVDVLASASAKDSIRATERRLARRLVTRMHT
jgi:hypothetical protein